MTETFYIDDENAIGWLLRNMSECDALTETGAKQKRHFLERFGAELESYSRELEYDLARKHGGAEPTKGNQ